MKKIAYLFVACSISALALTSCHGKDKEKILGIWQLRLMDINGTKLQGSSLGSWLWEFNGEGGYLSEIAGAKEKGRYEFKGSKLNLQPVTNKNRPAQSYTIAKLDSVEMELVSTDDKNKTELYFSKIHAGNLGDKD